MNSLPRPIVILSLLAVLLAGCGGGGGSDDGPDKPDPAAKKTTSAPPAFDAEPADGITLTTADFSYRVPEGWKDVRELLPSATSVAADGTDGDGFADSVNIMRVDPAPVTDLGDLEDGSITELEGIKATDLKVLDRAQVAGSPAIHIFGGLAQGGGEYNIDQFNIIRDDVSYVVTFSYSTDVSETDRAAVYESVLVTWKWTA